MTKKIFLWTVPRCISTAFERAHYEREDCKIMHEPFSQPFYFSFEKKSDMFNEIRETSFKKVYNDIFNYKSPDKYLFIKDMAYYIDFTLSNPKYYFPRFLEDNIHHTFLIRHPQRSIYSLYNKSCMDNQDTKWKYFDENEAGFKSIYKFQLDLILM